MLPQRTAAEGDLPLGSERNLKKTIGKVKEKNKKDKESQSGHAALVTNCRE